MRSRALPAGNGRWGACVCSGMRSSRLLVPLALAGGALLAGCSDDSPSSSASASPSWTSSPVPPSSPPSSPSPSPTASPTPSPTAAGESLDSPVLRPGANTRPARGEGTDTTGRALLREVRVGAHQGFDRVVLEFETEGTPDYVVEYVDAPVREDGSGHVVEVAGDARLRITMQGASGVAFDEDPYREVYTGPKRIRTAQLDNVLEVVSTGDFEAVMTWHVGVRTPEPFTVRALSDPARLVLDVRTP